MAAPVDSRTLSKISRKVAFSAEMESAPSSYTATTGSGRDGCSDGGAGAAAASGCGSGVRTWRLCRRACCREDVCWACAIVGLIEHTSIATASAVLIFTSRLVNADVVLQN